MGTGYYRFPTISSRYMVVFVCEDDLWSVPAGGGIARRLTANLGEVSRPCLSPDGGQLAFVGREEGQSEIYVMPALGGAAQRLTYMGGSLCLTAGWTDTG
jgi:tricorn protease